MAGRRGKGRDSVDGDASPTGPDGEREWSSTHRSTQLERGGGFRLPPPAIGCPRRLPARARCLLHPPTPVAKTTPSLCATLRPSTPPIWAPPRSVSATRAYHSGRPRCCPARFPCRRQTAEPPVSAPAVHIHLYLRTPKSQDVVSTALCRRVITSC